MTPADLAAIEAEYAPDAECDYAGVAALAAEVRADKAVIVRLVAYFESTASDRCPDHIWFDAIKARVEGWAP